MCGCGGGGGQGGVDVLPQKRCIFVWGEKCAQEKVMDIFVIVRCCKYCVPSCTSRQWSQYGMDSDKKKKVVFHSVGWRGWR